LVIEDKKDASTGKYGMHNGKQKLHTTFFIYNLKRKVQFGDPGVEEDIRSTLQECHLT
jgi:hypothetical protein